MQPMGWETERLGSRVSLVNGDIVVAADVGRRLGAAVIDLLIPVTAAAIVSVVALIVHIPQFIAYDFGSADSEWLTNLKIILWAMWVTSPGLAAWYGARRIAKRAQSLGERASGIRTVRVEDGRVPEVSQALIRQLLPVGAAAVAVSAILLALPPRSVLTVLQIGGACWFIAQLSTVSSRLGQSWNDTAAETVTIRVGPGGP